MKTRLCFVLILCHSWLDKVESSKIDDDTFDDAQFCEIYVYDCPPKMLCVIDDGGKYGHCVCDRFYGFYGPNCKKLASASYLLLVCCILGLCMMIRAFYYNLSLVYRLSIYGYLKADATGRSAFFNMLVPFPPAMLCVGFMFGVLEIDKDMYFHEFLRLPGYTCVSVTYLLSAMSISLIWIETVGKSKLKKTYDWKYKSILYGVSAASVVASFLSYMYNFTAFLAILECLVVAYSYHYARDIVVKALTPPELNGEVIIHPNAMNILNTIKSTAKVMTRYSVLMSLAFLAVGFTITVSRPLHKHQNHLPRYAQGQLFFFLVCWCLYKMNVHICRYLAICVQRDIKRHARRTGLSEMMMEVSEEKKHTCSNLFLSIGALSKPHRSSGILFSSSYFSSDTDSDSTSKGAGAGGGRFTGGGDSPFFLSSEFNFFFGLRRSSSGGSIDGRAVSGRTIVSSALSVGGISNRSSAILSLDPSSRSGTPFVKVDIDIPSKKAKGKIVVERRSMCCSYSYFSPLKFENVEGEEEASTKPPSDQNEEYPYEAAYEEDQCTTLSVGSHCFVKCYGESFLRVPLSSSQNLACFKNDYLVLLAECCDNICLAGELLVDSEGKVVRWILNSSFLNVPRFIMDSASLSFELAWVVLLESDITEMDPFKYDRLQASKSLVKVEVPGIVLCNVCQSPQVACMCELRGGESRRGLPFIGPGDRHDLLRRRKKWLQRGPRLESRTQTLSTDSGISDDEMFEKGGGGGGGEGIEGGVERGGGGGGSTCCDGCNVWLLQVSADESYEQASSWQLSMSMTCKEYLSQSFNTFRYNVDSLCMICCWQQDNTNNKPRKKSSGHVIGLPHSTARLQPPVLGEESADDGETNSIQDTSIWIKYLSHRVSTSTIVEGVEEEEEKEEEKEEWDIESCRDKKSKKKKIQKGGKHTKVGVSTQVEASTESIAPVKEEKPQLFHSDLDSVEIEIEMETFIDKG